MEDKLNIYFSVFNQHINSAGVRAIKIVNEMYDEESEELKELNRMYKNGIMEIFKVEPNIIIGSYFGLVYYFVNDKREI